MNPEIQCTVHSSMLYKHCDVCRWMVCRVGECRVSFDLEEAQWGER